MAGADSSGKHNSNKSNWWHWPLSAGFTKSCTEQTSLPGRYENDLKQAMVMKSKKPLSSKFSTSDVDLVIRSLEKASNYRRNGELEASLKLYEQSIELSIALLRECPEVIAAHGTEKSTLEALVASALDAAENVKATLQRSGQHQPTSVPACQSLSSRSDDDCSSRSITRALSSALEKKGPATQKKTAQKPRSSGGTTGIRQRPKQQSSGAASGTLRPPHAPPPANDSSNSQLRQMVMSDFFVPRASLQKTTWKDISGLDNVKVALQESAILPLMRPDLFNGLRKAQNILLWGPPGTGKTMLVRAAAVESQCNLFVVTAGTLTSKWMGEAEKLVKELFLTARQSARSIIFVDEVDSLLSNRKSDGEHEASRRLKTEIMVQMDGISPQGSNNSTGGGDSGQVLVLACTNCPWDIDSAVLRRFPRRIHVPLPDAAARQGLLKALLKKAGKHSLKSRDITSLVKRTEGYSCSDISSIASEASFGPLRTIGTLDDIRNVEAKDIPPISLADFENAIRQVSPSVSKAQLEKYREWQEQASSPRTT